MTNPSDHPPQPERTPEEAALMLRLRVFITMRWFAIAGVIVTALVASAVFHIGFPALPVYLTCTVMTLYNLVLFRQARNLEKEKPESIIPKVRNVSYIHIILDLIALTVLIHFTGGLENPFIFFYIFHIITGSIVLHYTSVYLLATLAMALVTLLVGLEYAMVIPHHTLVGFASPAEYRQISHILATLVALAAVLYITTYSATAISGELRKRQREVVQLRERLLAEKTGELERASTEVAKLQEEKRRFVRFIGMAAHDLKSPLTAIQGFLWVILGGFAGELTDKQRNMLERSSRRITELLDLISDLLDIPRIETGQLVPEMQEISLGEVIETSADEQRQLAADMGISLKVELPEALPRITGSAPRLQQVMSNLVNNAIKYNKPGGTATIRVTERDADVLVEVMDTGVGIPPQDLPRLFEDFFRASNAKVNKGTGLGLSITRRIVEAHGGRIWAESPCPESNTGSRFSFTLPKTGKKSNVSLKPG